REIAPTLDAHSWEFYSLPAELKLDWLAESHPTGRLLEVGCGSGHFLAAARRRGYDVAGIEASPRRAARRARALGLPVESSLLEESCAARATFDVVYHTDLLSHFPDPIGALTRMRDLLKEGGILFFDVGIDGGHWQPSRAYPQHLWYYSREA